MRQMRRPSLYVVDDMNARCCPRSATAPGTAPTASGDTVRESASASASGFDDGGSCQSTQYAKNRRSRFGPMPTRRSLRLVQPEYRLTGHRIEAPFSLEITLLNLPFAVLGIASTVCT